jgi:hypothetical protein
MMNKLLLGLSVWALLGSSTACFAQSTANSHCEKSAAARPSQTPPEHGPKSGSAPGNMGSTGWTGGTGGSHIGEAGGGPLQGSNSQQPEEVQGLDPTKDKTAKGC